MVLEKTAPVCQHRVTSPFLAKWTTGQALTGEVGAWGMQPFGGLEELDIQSQALGPETRCPGNVTVLLAMEEQACPAEGWGTHWVRKGACH